MFDINWLAILIAAVIYNAIGFAWYSDSLFGKSWKQESGMTKYKTPQAPKNMGRMFFFMVVVSLVMAYVISIVLNAFESATIASGATVAFWLWLGFVATVFINGVVYELKSWKYFMINAGYQLVGMIVMASVLVLLG